MQIKELLTIPIFTHLYITECKLFLKVDQLQYNEIKESYNSSLKMVYIGNLSILVISSC